MPGARTQRRTEQLVKTAPLVSTRTTEQQQEHRVLVVNWHITSLAAGCALGSRQ